MVSVIALAIMIAGVLAVLNSVFDSNATTSRALVDDGEALSEIVQARISATTALISGDDIRSNVDVTLTNTGNLEYGDFDEWHVTVEYWPSVGSFKIEHLSFSDVTTDNRWMLRSIFEDAASALDEEVGKDVLNPSEEMMVRIRLNPAVKEDTRGRVTVTPPVGEPTSVFFSA